MSILIRAQNRDLLGWKAYKTLEKRLVAPVVLLHTPLRFTVAQTFIRIHVVLRICQSNTYFAQ